MLIQISELLLPAPARVCGVDTVSLLTHFRKLPGATEGSQTRSIRSGFLCVPFRAAFGSRQLFNREPFRWPNTY